MSGIVGFINKSKNKKEIIKEMSLEISHRGPHNEDYYIDQDIAIGYRYMALDYEYDKIIYNEDNRYLIVCDGEVNNYDELREKLKHHKFKTDNYLEVIIHGYEEWKEEIFKKIRGTYALAIWDNKEKELVIARDGFGSKPLYYYKDIDNFMFSSESKAFLKNPEYKKELNEEILAAYLCFNSIPTSETFLKNVYKLSPGTYIKYKNNDIIMKEFFKLEFNVQDKELSEYVKEIDNAVKDSVKVNSNGKRVGSFLSSGIDSSYLVSLLKPCDTFTISYSDLKYSEIKYAKDLTEKLGINSNEVIVSKEEYIKDFDKIMYYMDEPLANPSLPAIYLLTREASKKVDVVFSGEGADELFGGYNVYQEELSMLGYMKIPFFIRRTLSMIASIFPDARGFNFLYRRGLKMEDYNIGLGRVFRDKEAISLLNNKEQIRTKDVVKPIYDKYKNNTNLEKRQVIDYYYWLINDFSFAVDKTSAMFSMIGRTPYLDNKVLEVSMKLPQSAKISKTETKIALRMAAKKSIPNESYKKKKLGFPVPLREWLREEYLYEIVKEEFESLEAKKIFRQDKILKLLENHKNNKKDNYKKIWCIYSFLVWYKEYFVKR